MRFSLILLGSIFLFSPDISMLDFMPDFIGWSLLLLGIQRLADIELRAEDSKSLAKRMILISMVKLVLSLFTFRFSTADLLLVSFCYAIVELITVFPLVSNLFSGLDYCAMRVGSPLDSDKLNVAKWYMYVFFTVKNLLTVLPATTSLFDKDVTGNYSADTWFIDFAAAARVFMVFAFFLAFILFVVMTVFFVPFWHRIYKNRDLNQKMLDNRRSNVLEVSSHMLRKNTAFVISMLATSVIFFADFYVDGIDVLPDFIGYIGILTASLFAVKRMHERAKALCLFSIMGIVVSAVSFIYRFIPLLRAGFVVDYAFSKKTLTIPIAIFDAIALVLVYIFIFRLTDDFNKKYVKHTLEDSVFLYILGGAVLAFFGFVLYALPEMNTTFVFPSLIYNVAFSALSVNYILKLGRQIRLDNKD